MDNTAFRQPLARRRARGVCDPATGTGRVTGTRCGEAFSRQGMGGEEAQHLDVGGDLEAHHPDHALRQGVRAAWPGVAAGRVRRSMPGWT